MADVVANVFLESLVDHHQRSTSSIGLGIHRVRAGDAPAAVTRGEVKVVETTLPRLERVLIEEIDAVRQLRREFCIRECRMARDASTPSMHKCQGIAPRLADGAS